MPRARAKDCAFSRLTASSERAIIASQLTLTNGCGYERMRKQNPPEGGVPGMRLVLLHSLSHAVMRQIALECGYTAGSLRERLYCRMPGQEHGPMAGILIYTAASDSEGTLGGLVQLQQSQLMPTASPHAVCTRASTAPIEHGGKLLTGC